MRSAAARPGLRGETLDRYISRLQELEGLRSSFLSWSAAMALVIQAGREVRVIVDPER